MDADNPLPIPNSKVASNPNATGKEDDSGGQKEIALVPEKPDHNRTSYCLPAQPVVAEASPLPDLSDHTSEEGEETSTVFVGWEGRCHSPKYSCLEYQGHIPHESNLADAASSDSAAAGSEVTTGGEDASKVVNESHHCFLPRMVRNLKRFRIVQIQRRQQAVKTPVLFVGNVMDLYNGMRNSEYVPRSWFLSNFFGFSGFSKLPEKLETMLLLTAGLSAGLAVVNMLPIYGLDGDYTIF